MTYKSITTLVHDPERKAYSLENAINLSRTLGSHLHVAALGVDHTDPGFYYAGAQAIAVQQNLERAQVQAHALEEQVRQRMKPEMINWDVETVTVMMNGLSPYLSDYLRYYDMVILPLPYGPACGAIDEMVFESCLFGAGIPVLLTPERDISPILPRRILIGWDRSSEALAAARSAIPFCAQAEATEVCVIEPPVHGPERSDPGGSLAQLLVRNGAHVEISVQARQETDVADQLLHRARETGADLMVIGGYGHTRLREALLGGVTRTMLHKADIPILMAR